MYSYHVKEISGNNNVKFVKSYSLLYDQAILVRDRSALLGGCVVPAA